MRIEPLQRYSYIDGGALTAALEDNAILDGLMKGLEVPGKPGHLRKLAPPEKRAAIEQQIRHLREMKTSLWYEVDTPHVLAGCLWSFWGNSRDAKQIFGRVPRESELFAPVAEWLRMKQGLVVHKEVQMATKRCDVLGYREGRWLSPEKFVCVELKNEFAQLKRGLDQMTTFKEYANEVYLACTTRFALEFLQKHAEAPSVRHWDPEVLNNKLRQLGIGLLVVDWPGELPRVEEVLAPKSSALSAPKRREVFGQIEGRVPHG
jgi:hypothetical protein